MVLLAASIGTGLLVCEAAARIVLNPSDYLSVEMVADDILGAAPSRDVGFDALGFRNRSVPDATDIVAIGDSHTYGNTATMNDSWPYVLGRMSGRRVYNMGMGGYGPNQYFHLLRTKAAGMKPRVVIAGLYLGDDFENAFLITYGLAYWQNLRQGVANTAEFNIWTKPQASSWHKAVRLWLSRHSVTYQLVFHASIFGAFHGEAQIKDAHRLSDSVATLNIPGKNILEAFHPNGVLRNLDQDSPAVQEGMRITLELLERMNTLSQELGAQFIVVIIPTKEMVFAEHLGRDAQLALYDVVQKLIDNEGLARQKLFEFLQRSHIHFVDTLPALRRNVSKSLYARSAVDMHPGRNGYRVIGEAVFEALQNGELKDRVRLPAASHLAR